MVLITEELVRKRSEHNECVISTLEELTLHQEDIEKIEHLQNWCRDLKILLLQSNLISKIENLNKMKYLEYLNLALNNIELIENLEGCESLQKLDLTLNFVGELQSVERLKANHHLEQLYLSGNPCTDYEGYREFVIATLPQLKTLDGVEIERSDRIKALQAFGSIKATMIADQIAYRKQRAKQKEASAQKIINTPSSSNGEDETNYWSEISDNTPETRVELANRSRRSRDKGRGSEENDKPTKRQIILFKEDGRPNNVNEAKIPFTFEEDDEKNCYVLTLRIYKHLDTALLDVDVQPCYVTVRIKGKVFQIALGEEVVATQSSAQRSQTTGHLVITMPKMKGEIKAKPAQPNYPSHKGENISTKNAISKRQYLEIGGEDNEMDFSKIVESNRSKHPLAEKKLPLREKKPPEDFQDDPTVPPLE
uniref:U2A'/phosphoprotein 32 family A C-terminal domain-containing protein n=2 Tax=Graphocephala atropunctata TaxID=36148 RepID=A0A1B6MIK3_9HEMI